MKISGNIKFGIISCWSVLLFFAMDGCRNKDSDWLDSEKSVLPLKVGNYWVYKNILKDNGLQFYEMWYVSAHQTIAGRRFALIKMRRWDDKHPIIDSPGEWTEYLTRNEKGEIWGYRWTGDKSFIKYKGDKFLSDMSLMYAVKDSVGKRWMTRLVPDFDQATLPLQLVTTTDSLVLSDETIYGCYRIDSKESSDTLSGVPYQFWYKEGVGMLASRSGALDMTLIVHGNMLE
jgi:hypothetical protein